MMPQPWAKLFDTAAGQFLAFKCDDDDGDAAICFKGAAVGGISPTAITSYVTAKDRDRIFGDFGAEAAEDCAAKLREVAAGFAGQ